MNKNICTLFAGIVLLVVITLFDDHGVIPQLAEGTSAPTVAPAQADEPLTREPSSTQAVSASRVAPLIPAVPVTEAQPVNSVPVVQIE